MNRLTSAPVPKSSAAAALKSHRPLVRTAPRHEMPQCLLAPQHYEQNYAAAVPYLERAYELDPTEADYGIVLAAAYFGLNETAKWDAMYDMLAQEHPEEEEIYLDWGIALHATGEIDRAMDITQIGLKQNPNSYRLMYRLSAICYLTGQHAAAEYLLETALTVNVEEHTQMFIFAPELKKASSLLRIIARFVNPGL